MSERVVAQTDPKFRVDVEESWTDGPPNHRLEYKKWVPDSWFDSERQATFRMRDIGDRYRRVRVVEVDDV